MHVVEAGTGRTATVDTHSDLRKHAFGTCPVCARRLMSHPVEAPAPAAEEPTRAEVPTRFLVQTSTVPEERA